MKYAVSLLAASLIAWAGNVKTVQPSPNALPSAEHTWVRVVENYSSTKSEVLHLRTDVATVVVLPVKEKVRSAYVGNEDAFKATYDGNTVIIKPTALVNIRETSLHVVTMSDHPYSFYVVRDDSKQPDLTVIIAPSAKLDEEIAAAPTYILGSSVSRMQNDLDDWRADAKQCRLDLQAAKAEVVHAVKEASVKAEIKTAAKAPVRYQFKAKEAPFNLINVWGDADTGITRIRANPTKQYALLEYDGDKPHVVMPVCDGDTCTVTHPIPRGKLVIDKRSTEFYQIP